ncbi:hypothetical protein CK203_051458 [Vitis vinifera]|uniref:Uncharacterized protein n=1 Tax=Vitis vinifera TaxID=29760 RepID=A0A438H1B6_VITVI|nr:hypothetical protein CK203_051458 [Vitis vinifera]
MNFMSYVVEVSRGWDEPNARDMGRMTSQPNAKALGEECPTIPAVREMFGDCNTYNSNWRDHPNFSWKPQPPQYQQPAQAPQQASSLEQAMVNLSKVVGDFVGAQKSINAQFANLNIVQEKENSPSQPYQNSMSIHEMEAKEGEPSQKKEVKEVITLRSGKEVDLPTCKLEHKVESETEKEKREEIKGKKKGKSIEKDDYIDEEPQRIVIKKELMKKHMPPPFLQAFCETVANHQSMKDPIFAGKAPFRRGFRSCETTFGTRVPFRSTVTLISQLRNGCEMPKRKNFQFRSQSSISQGVSQLRSHFLAHEYHLEAPYTHFVASKWL